MPHPRLIVVSLLLLLVTGFVLRLLPAIRSPFIYDEYKLAKIVDQTSLAPRTLNIPLHGDNHPPGQVYLSYLGATIVGHNVVGYRAMGVLLGTGAILVAFALGSVAAGPLVGLLAAAFVTFNEYCIGASRTGTELGSVFFLALLALLLTWRAIERPSTARLAGLGLILGLALLVKESTVLWIAPIGALLISKAGGRQLLRSRAFWVLPLVTLVVATPALVWTLWGQAVPGDPSSHGLEYQAGRLSFGSWSWGPLSLYVRPLYYYRVEGHISEYVSMTTLPGLVVLAGAAASLFVRSDAWSRFLQLLGFGSFLFIALFTTPRGEFWWGDLSLPPMLLLAAASVAPLLRRHWLWAVVLAIGLVPPALRVAMTRDNYFPLDWGTPDRVEIAALRGQLTYAFLPFRDRDHLALYRFGSRQLPPLDFYRQQLTAYRDFLVALRTGGITDSSAVQHYRDIATMDAAMEERWVSAELARVPK